MSMEGGKEEEAEAGWEYKKGEEKLIKKKPGPLPFARKDKWRYTARGSK
jgi:hypothetical protein